CEAVRLGAEQLLGQPDEASDRAAGEHRGSRLVGRAQTQPQVLREQPEFEAGLEPPRHHEPRELVVDRRIAAGATPDRRQRYPRVDPRLDGEQHRFGADDYRGRRQQVVGELDYLRLAGGGANPHYRRTERPQQRLDRRYRLVLTGHHHRQAARLRSWHPAADRGVDIADPGGG